MAEPFQFAPAELVVHVSELETTLQFETQRPLLKSIGQMDGFQRRVIRWPVAAWSRDSNWQHKAHLLLQSIRTTWAI